MAPVCWLAVVLALADAAWAGGRCLRRPGDGAMAWSYEARSGKCFAAVHLSGAANFSAARATCAAFNATLATVPSLATNTFITSPMFLPNRHVPKLVMIGLRFEHGRGRWDDNTDYSSERFHAFSEASVQQSNRNVAVDMLNDDLCTLVTFDRSTPAQSENGRWGRVGCSLALPKPVVMCSRLADESDVCSPGTHVARRGGVRRCQFCALNAYQPLFNQDSCHVCPGPPMPGYFIDTQRPGATSQMQCYRPLPTLTDFEPKQGIFAGGTVIHVYGDNFFVDDDFMVLFNNKPGRLKDSDSHSLTIVAPPLNGSEVAGPAVTTFQLMFNREIFIVEYFTYRPNPVVYQFSPDEFTAGAGQNITVEGENLDAAGEVALLIEVAESEAEGGSGKLVIRAECLPANSSVMVCPMPDMYELLPGITQRQRDEPDDNRTMSISARSGGRPKQGPRNGAAWVDDECAPAIGARNGNRNFWEEPEWTTSFAFEFDNGFVVRPETPGASEVVIYDDPVLDKWQADRTVELPPEAPVDLVIEGAGLTCGLTSADYAVSVGPSQPCAVRTLNMTAMTCRPRFQRTGKPVRLPVSVRVASKAPVVVGYVVQTMRSTTLSTSTTSTTTVSTTTEKKTTSTTPRPRVTTVKTTPTTTKVTKPKPTTAPTTVPTTETEPYVEYDTTDAHVSSAATSKAPGQGPTNTTSVTGESSPQPPTPASPTPAPSKPPTPKPAPSKPAPTKPTTPPPIKVTTTTTTIHPDTRTGGFEIDPWATDESFTAEQEESRMALLIGVAVGVGVALLLIVLTIIIVCVLWRRRRRRKSAEPDHAQPEPPPPVAAPMRRSLVPAARNGSIHNEGLSQHGSMEVTEGFISLNPRAEPDQVADNARRTMSGLPDELSAKVSSLLIASGRIRVESTFLRGHFGELAFGYWAPSLDRQVPTEPVLIKSLNRFMERSSVVRKFLDDALLLDGCNENVNCLAPLAVAFRRGRPLVLYPHVDGVNLKIYLSDESVTILIRQMVDLAAQVASAMVYLSETRNIIHRDIAARNCIISPDNHYLLKLTDAALVGDMHGLDYEFVDEAHDFLPVRWAAPETLLRLEYSAKTDVWSFGVLLWEIFTRGERPFGDVHSVNIVNELRERAVMWLGRGSGEQSNHPPILAQPVHMPPEVFDVMSSCCHPRPQHRKTFPFLNDHLTMLLDENETLPAYNRPVPTQ